MKTSLDNLPKLKRLELERVVEVLRQSFAEATSTKRADRLKNGRILKIILYGSDARGDWVHDPVGRYFSDFDILFDVDHEDLSDPEYWEAALWRTPVSFIVQETLRNTVRAICEERLAAYRRRPAISRANSCWTTFELPEPSGAFDG